MQNDKHDIYKLLSAGYYGEDGFLDGSYLEKHPRESNEKYVMRKKLAYYLNYLAPCVDAHVAPVFKTLAVREWKGTAESVWKTFSENVDFRNTKVEDLMKQAALSAKLYGIAYIVMDKVEGDAEDLRLSDLEKDRKNIPYAYVLDVNTIKEVKTDRFGNITKLVFCEPDAHQENAKATRTLMVDGWEIEDSKGKRNGTWDLGCVPVIPLTSKTYNSPFPPSEFLSIAKTNLAIYNKCSLLSDILVNQTFSILTYPSNNPESIVLGTNNALSYPLESSNAPQFIAPSDGPADVLMRIIANLQQEIYRMAVVVNVTGSNKLQSGEAKAWDYEATNQILSDFANRVEQAEMRLAELFCKWTGLELDYKVNYPSDFKISAVEQELANAEIAKGLNFGDDFNMEVFKRILTSYLPELKAEEFDALVKAYENQQAQEKLDYAHGEGGGDNGEGEPGRAGGQGNNPQAE